MRFFQLTGDGLDTLRMAEGPSPRPGPGQVRVRMRAASLNYRDLLVAAGREARGMRKRPLVPLSDGAGEVVEIGPGVTRLAPGDRVVGCFFQGWADGPYQPEMGASALGGAIDGVLSEEVLFSEAGAARLPEGFSFEEGATLPCAGVTAWVGLVEKGGLRAGETVLAMGTGGVSVFALQIAKLLGARVILTSSHDDKLERGRALGADATINYRATPAWDEAARAFTGGRGVDHILEVGGARTLPLALRALRQGGHLSIVGLLSGERADPEAAAGNDRQIRVDSVYVGSTGHLAALSAAMARAGVRPVVDRVFAFEEVRRAYETMERGEHFGKIVVQVSP
ncbi:MAG TPA: NAD(P)-dependent alcohol dehydrogenase [Anaeromyxobacter sp.]|nr:NAD(P)-dependent alcohol dehydrogenase [Anaeromyxobacter sp.]